MTQLLATENEISVDAAGFEAEMEKQRERGRAAQKKDVIVATTEGTATAEATKFVGYELEVGHAIHATLVDVVKTEKATFLVFDQTPFYAEMGGQVGDAGHALINGAKVDLVDCVKDKAGRHLHKVAVSDQLSAISPGAAATLSVDLGRRRAITRHHSATHLLQWALRKVLGTHVRQSGTHKTPERLRFDFSHFEAVTAAQLLEVEQLVNAKVIDNSRVVSAEIEFAKKPDDVLAFFGDKYGKYVRVVDIGGFSKELCGGTHVATTGEIGVIKISAEMAIAAGTRRIEAVAGQPALDFIAQREAALAAVSAHLSAGPVDVAKKLETLLAHQKELEKQLKAFHQRESAEQAKKLAENPQMEGGLKIVRTFVSDVASMESLKDLSSNLSSQGIDVVHLFARTSSETISNVSSCSHTAINSGWKANTLVSQASKILGGKGGGKPDFAMGGGKDESKIPDALQIRP
jgi:alanyl-tRNA synthetase